MFHVNMLKEWHVPNSVSYFSSEEGEGDSGSEDVPLWNDGGVPVMGERSQKLRARAADTTYY